VGGLVRAASADLAYRDILVNAILPGVLDGPMTRASLSDDQLKSVVSATDFGRLAEASDIVGLTLYLCSDANRSVTGQSIHVDLGFSHVKRL
jgi:NAD(P)-dependent dehydrogenase (short-subunit alcohol dehydrogenase family)